MFQIPPSRYILPNLFTVAATLCGFGIIGIVLHAEAGWEFFLASTLVPLACILDGFDGRVARLVHGESEFGVQLDSLSDFATFGVAPAALIYAWALDDLGPIGFAVAFVFAAASMLRLARFNVRATEDPGASRYFEGLPAPMGGMAIAGLVAIETGVLGRFESAPGAAPAIVAFVLLMAGLMVSTVPFRTFKDLRVSPRSALFLASVLSIIVILSIRFDVMFALSVFLFTYIFAGLSGAFVRGPVRRVRRAAARGTASPRIAAADLDDEDDDDDV